MGARRDSAASDASENGTAVRWNQYYGEADEYQRQRDSQVKKDKKKRAEDSRYENVPSRVETQQRREREEREAAAKRQSKR